MIVNGFSVRDRLAASYGVPMFAQSKDIFLRQLQLTMMANRDQMKDIPVADLDIYYVGDFDEKSGQFFPVQPSFVIALSDLLGGVNDVPESVSETES